MIKMLFILLIGTATGIRAQTGKRELPDSIRSVNLKEVVIQGQTQYTFPTKSMIIPSAKQKSASQNAVDLLRQVNMPQLKINPVDNAITTPVGAEVTLFINYIPASAEEMEGLRTEDVKRIEYLDFPTDPRFMNKEHVVNIVVQTYEYGGYTKATVNESFLVGLSSQVSAYSKFSYKKMTYDLYFSANNVNNHHEGNSTQGTFRLQDNEGVPLTIIRDEKLVSAHYKQNYYPVTFRAAYSTDKMQILNTVGFKFTEEPANNASGSLTYTPSHDTGYSYNKDNSSRSYLGSWQGNYYFVFPRKYSLNIEPEFNYTHNNFHSSFSSSNPGSSPILNKASENAYAFSTTGTAQKQFADHHSVITMVRFGINVNRVHYPGQASSTENFHHEYAGGCIGYNFTNEKINGFIYGGGIWEGNAINNVRINRVFPFTYLQARYAPNSKNSLSCYFMYDTNSPRASDKNPKKLQENELMYFSGNPRLKNAPHMTFNLSYTWMPTNALSTLLYAQHFDMSDRWVTAYFPTENNRKMLRTYINSGNFYQTQVGLSLTCKLFDDNLQLSATPAQMFYHSTGYYKYTHNPFIFDTSATYYLNSFFFQAYYEMQKRFISTDDSGTFRKVPDFYQLVAGWHNSNWNVKLTLANMFRNNWNAGSNKLKSPSYDQLITLYGHNFHQRINLSVTYTIGYGKKIKQGNEVGAQEGVGSAILK